jgi:hypothetical protein
MYKTTDPNLLFCCSKLSESLNDLIQYRVLRIVADKSHPAYMENPTLNEISPVVERWPLEEISRIMIAVVSIPRIINSEKRNPYLVFFWKTKVQDELKA